MLVCVNFTKSDIDRGSIYKILDTDDYTVEDILGSDLQKALINKVIDVCNISMHKGSYGYIYYKIDNVKLIDRGYNELAEDLVIVVSSSHMAVWKNNNLIMFELERTISKNNIKYSYVSKKFKSDSFIYINIYLDSGSICMCVVEDECNGVRGLKNEEVIHCKKEDIKKVLLFR